MGVMSLGIPYGASVNVIANGEDEEQVIDAVNTVIKRSRTCEVENCVLYDIRLKVEIEIEKV